MAATLALLTCLVVGIADGDTLTAKCPDSTIKIRLAEIDAPEKKQPFGNRSKQSLSDLCFQQQASIQPIKKDRYQRTVANVACQGKDVGRYQVQTGMAWVYDKYATDHSLYKVQATAKGQRLGLWSDTKPIPPWEWRKESLQSANTNKTE